MEKCRRQQVKHKAADCEEVSSIEWKDIDMSDQEEDLVFRMHRLVGDRWDLIAGRIPGRTDKEVERFWIMKHRQVMHVRPNKRTNTDQTRKKQHPTSLHSPSNSAYNPLNLKFRAS